MPIGFAIEPNYYAPYDMPPVKSPVPMVGLSCSACHSGRLDVAGPKGRITGVLIEGGSAMIDLGSFEEAVGKALLYTKLIPLRWSRFASSVLGGNLPNSDPRKQTLLADLAAAAAVVEKLAKEEKQYGKFLGGFSRTDALAPDRQSRFRRLQRSKSDQDQTHLLTFRIFGVRPGLTGYSTMPRCARR